MNISSTMGSLHYHSFGCYDHFCHVDSSISKFNYLKFSNFHWRIIDNVLQPQNRRSVDFFERAFDKAGFDIISNMSSKPNMFELNKLNKIHADFNSIPKEILAVDYGTYFLKKR